MQRVVVIPYRRFGKITRSHLQGSRDKKNPLLKMGLVGCPETSVRNCHYLRNNAEQWYFSQFDNRLSGVFLNTCKNTLCAKFISINTLMPPVVNICEVLITSRDVIAPTLRTVSQIIYRGGQELN